MMYLVMDLLFVIVIPLAFVISAAALVKAWRAR